MSIHVVRRTLLSSSALLFALSWAEPVRSQDVALPEIVVEAKRPAPPRRKTVPTLPRPATAPAAPRPDPNAVLAGQNTQFDIARDNLSPRFGASSFDMNRAFIESLPQGSDGSINKALLQAPGVTQDSAASGEIHVRNEHANLQYRINGITLPDGISGFGHVLDSKFIGNLALITGALPAQYGLRTSGVVDIQTQERQALQQGGSVGVYGGSFGTVTPSFEYGGRAGATEYFFTGRGFTSNLGIENPTASRHAIHDRTEQGNFFSYTSTLIDPDTRVATIFGNTTNRFQIPNNPGQTFAADSPAFGVSNFDSSQLNENQAEQNTFGVVALQKSVNEFDGQIAAFTRYSSLHFKPDTVGDLVFNGIASDVAPELGERSSGRRRLPAQRLTHAPRRDSPRRSRTPETPALRRCCRWRTWPTRPRRSTLRLASPISARRPAGSQASMSRMSGG